MKWIISVPVNGKFYIKRFLSGPFQSMLRALEQIDTPWQFLIHTNQPELLTEVSRRTDSRVTFLPYPEGNPYEAFGKAHHEAINSTGFRDAICLLCADITVSIECFKACEDRFKQGFKAIYCAGTRTNPPFPPIGAKSRELLEYGVNHMHQINRDTIWGKAKSKVPSILQFGDKDNLTMRAFHLHPFAIIKDRDFPSFGVTIDAGLAAWFWEEEIHIVADPDEMSVLETSPKTKYFGRFRQHLTVDFIAQWSYYNINNRHLWFFQHPIVLTGNKPKLGEDIANKILDKLGVKTPQLA